MAGYHVFQLGVGLYTRTTELTGRQSLPQDVIGVAFRPLAQSLGFFIQVFESEHCCDNAHCDTVHYLELLSFLMHR